MNSRPATSTSGSNRRSVDLAVPETPARLVTVIVGIVVALTFLFGFGNVLALGLRLGVPIWVAPLVAPAVDLSVVALLLGTRHLAVHGGPANVLRSARRLLIFTSMVTLALNVAEPLLAGHYGKATFDAVGPLLLIGWSEVGPGLLQAMRPARSDIMLDGAPAGRGAHGFVAAEPHAQRERPATTEMRPARKGTLQTDSMARDQDLLHRAWAEDVLHWQQYQRPISAETLRKRLHVGTPTARKLVAQLRSDIHSQIENVSSRLDGMPQPAT
ncbi:hypothetical protein [Protofrankia coriariae]|uniref:DUF2637 domain-containing protein n=1 Tax=Protofrankia coriariae TaxID=1562887 RepID=A0ABR5EZ83_9ACTN|nr:hypothetical protein [Protofrankia coriariae]KLL09764.1 hypothetical protein FrCorBMG51_22695 [Protofrankia coriariae]